MNVLLVSALALTAGLVMGYDEMYDKIDVDKIIADDSLFTAYVDCMLDKGPCKEEHSEDFKKLLPEVVSTSCSKCTAIQKQNVRKSVKALTEKRPDDFLKFRAKYDPKGEYEKDFTAFVLGTD